MNARACAFQFCMYEHDVGEDHEHLDDISICINANMNRIIAPTRALNMLYIDCLCVCVMYMIVSSLIDDTENE